MPRKQSKPLERGVTESPNCSKEGSMENQPYEAPESPATDYKMLNDVLTSPAVGSSAGGGVGARQQPLVPSSREWFHPSHGTQSNDLHFLSRERNDIEVGASGSSSSSIGTGTGINAGIAASASTGKGRSNNGIIGKSLMNEMGLGLFGSESPKTDSGAGDSSCNRQFNPFSPGITGVGIGLSPDVNAHIDGMMADKNNILSNSSSSSNNGNDSASAATLTRRNMGIAFGNSSGFMDFDHINTINASSSSTYNTISNSPKNTGYVQSDSHHGHSTSSTDAPVIQIGDVGGGGGGDVGGEVGISAYDDPACEYSNSSSSSNSSNSSSNSNSSSCSYNSTNISGRYSGNKRKATLTSNGSNKRYSNSSRVQNDRNSISPNARSPAGSVDSAAAKRGTKNSRTGKSKTPSPTQIGRNYSNSGRGGPNQVSPEGRGNDGRIRCNCRKTKCIKLYCDCFRDSKFCEGCNCVDCSNTGEKEQERKNAISGILERNPEAFAPRIKEDPSGGGSKGHLSGCHCKKSACLKKYCECFSANVACSEKCRCLDCKNSNNNSGAGPSAGPEEVSPLLSSHHQQQHMLSSEYNDHMAMTSPIGMALHSQHKSILEDDMLGMLA